MTKNPTFKKIHIHTLQDFRDFVKDYDPPIEILCEIIEKGFNRYSTPEDWKDTEELTEALIREELIHAKTPGPPTKEKPLFLSPDR